MPDIHREHIDAQDRVTSRKAVAPEDAWRSNLLILGADKPDVLAVSFCPAVAALASCPRRHSLPEPVRIQEGAAQPGPELEASS